MLNEHLNMLTLLKWHHKHLILNFVNEKNIHIASEIGQMSYLKRKLKTILNHKSSGPRMNNIILLEI